MDEGKEGIPGFALRWDMGVHCGDPLLREAGVGSAPHFGQGVSVRKSCFGALLLNASNKCNPLAWTAEDTCRAGLGLFQGQTRCSSCLKKLLNFVKAFSGP